MLVFIFSSFLFCILLGIISLKFPFSKKENLILNGIIVVSLIIAAGFRDGMAGYPDYENYLDAYYYGSDQFEYSFTLIRNLSIWLDNGTFYYLFLIYATFAIMLKANGIYKLSSMIYFSWAVYISFFYLLHELIQIRVGIAAAIGILSLKSVYERKLIHFSLLIGMASFFHFSSLFYLPMYLLKSQKLNKIFWIGGIIVAFVFYFLSVNLIDFLFFIPIENIQMKLKAYQEATFMDLFTPINLFGRFEILHYFLLFVFVKFSTFFQSRNKYFFLLLKVYIIGLILRIILYPLPAFADRLYELCSITTIILIPMLIHLIKPRFIGVLVVMLICFCYLYSLISLRNLIPS